MPTIVLDLLKYVFLAVLYLFMARSVRAIIMELRPAPAARSAPAPRRAQPQRAPAKKTKRAPRKLAAIEGDGVKGKSWDLAGEILLGRGDRCTVVLQDAYASQVHARIFDRNDTLFVEDMGSTNGTYLNNQKLTSPTELQRGDRVKIGKTVLELRK